MAKTSWFDRLRGKKEPVVETQVEQVKATEAPVIVEEPQQPKINPNARYDSSTGYGGNYRYLGAISYNGEKNHGEMGPVKDYVLDYEGLRYRAWQLFLESELAQTVLSKFNTWVIGKGLKLQVEPVREILETSGIDLNLPVFAKSVESRFNLWAQTKMGDYSGMRSLHALEYEAFKNTKVGGDVLVVLRVIKGNVKVQLIDGAFVVSPTHGSEFYQNALKNGNRIVHGVEINPKGEHVAYYVRRSDQKGFPTIETERILAKGARTGMTMAYLYYGNKYRVDSVRGMPALSVTMETMKKLERYKEATVGSAEERQKIAYSIEHQQYSTGENPLLSQMAIARGDRNVEDDFPIDDLGNQMADKVAATTNKQTFNMPLGASLKALESKNELYFKDFYEVNIKLICASIEIPVDVALSSYNNSFSASRAALKDWENTLTKERAKHGAEFFQPIVDLWFWVEVLKNNIDAPGYLDAFNRNDEILLAAYTCARFVGSPVPHIDPVKEVTAERMKLGEAAKFTPLTTVEAATEALNGGDSEANVEQFALEMEKTKSLKIEPVIPIDPNKQQQNVKKA